MRYLATKPAGNPPKMVLDKLHALMKERKSRPVDVKGLRALEKVEKAFKGTTDCIGEFKYVTNQEMLALIERGAS
jgi:ferredoxin--NADP+ reductase